MKNNSVKSIADKLNISTSTVSRAIRHCGGVDSETRARILSEGRKMMSETPEGCSIYTILPDTPQYFWHELEKGITEELGQQCGSIKHNIYTSLHDEETVLDYLNDAEHHDAKVILVATHVTPSIQHKLETMTDDRLILFVSEHNELRNCFYVGANNYYDGYSLGQDYVSKYANRNLALVTIECNDTAKQRMSGFCQAIKEHDSALLESAVKIALKSNVFRDSKLFPSKFASILAQAKLPDSICIYFPIGTPFLSLAITKAKLSAICLCHDCTPQYANDNKYSNSELLISCNQNVQEQGRIAMKLANIFVKEGLYPEQKEYFIASTK